MLQIVCNEVQHTICLIQLSNPPATHILQKIHFLHRAYNNELTALPSFPVHPLSIQLAFLTVNSLG